MVSPRVEPRAAGPAPLIHPLRPLGHLGFSQVLPAAHVLFGGILGPGDMGGRSLQCHPSPCPQVPGASDRSRGLVWEVVGEVAACGDC